MSSMITPSVLVVVVDTQVDFVMSDGLLPVPGAEAIIAPGVRFLAGLDPAEVAGVLFTHDTHVREVYMGSPENLGDAAAGIPGFPLHCELGTPGWQNVFNPGLVPDGIPVHTLTKGVFDMWAETTRHDDDDNGSGWINHLERAVSTIDHSWSTPRDEWLGQPGGDGGVMREEGVDTVRVIGVASDYCVRWAVDGLLARGWRVEVVEALTAGIARDIAQTVEQEFPGQVEIV